MFITFQDIFERCMMEAAYLGRHAAEQTSDAERGKTDERTFSNQYIGRFNQLRIRQSDRQLLMTFIREGAHITESRLSALLQSQGDYTDETVTWQFPTDFNKPHPAPPFPHDNDEVIIVTNTAFTEMQDSNNEPDTKPQGLYGLMIDLLTAYALWRWLTDKQPDLAATFCAKWTDSIENIKKAIYTQVLRKPIKQKCKK